jgi:ABC-type multidrug transport system ATPase subunit
MLERVGLGGRELEIAAGLGAVDQARLVLASALVRTPEALVVRDVDRGLDGDEARVVRALLQSLASQERLSVLASSATASAAPGFADRLVAIADGLLVFDGHPADFGGERVAERFGTA